MIMDVKLPKLGEGADSGVVVSILVKEGDQVTEGQTIIELENEKAVAPVPSSAAGTVTKIRVKEGDKLAVGQVILSLGGKAAGKPARAAEAPPEGEDEAVAEEPAEEVQNRNRRQGSRLPGRRRAVGSRVLKEFWINPPPKWPPHRLCGNWPVIWAST